MVSLWPWKGDDTTTAHFEKTLSALNSKLSKANTQDTKLKTRARRFNFLCTLYASFIYILYTLILVLVTGLKRWGAVEYGLVVGGPVVLYTIRTALGTYYDYRISTNRAHITSLERQRRQAIDKFKQATKYDSTQQLLEKYGADEGKSSASAKPKDASKSKKSKDTSGSLTPKNAPAPRTNIAPPATANIRRSTGPPVPAQSPVSPSDQAQAFAPSPARPSPGFSPTSEDLTAEFAPNAEATPPQYAPEAGVARSAWYDRIMDLMLGEDENKPINRLALICSNCHLVNGQAPPGVKSLGDVGRWKCFSCRAWNGEESEVTRIVAAAAAVTKEDRGSPASPTADTGNEKQESIDTGNDKQESVESADEKHEADEGVENDDLDPNSAPPARSTRSRAEKT